jgi:hypothetical protein
MEWETKDTEGNVLMKRKYKPKDGFGINKGFNEAYNKGYEIWFECNKYFFIAIDHSDIIKFSKAMNKLVGTMYMPPDV